MSKWNRQETECDGWREGKGGVVDGIANWCRWRN